MAYNTLNTSGIDYTVVFDLNSQTPEYPNPPFVVGTISIGSSGTEYVYCQTTTAVALNAAVVIDPTYTATATANSATVQFGAPVGVSGAVVTAISGTVTKRYFWAARKGYVPVLAAAAAVTYTQLRTTATAGALDDVVAGATVYPVNGIVFTTTPTGSGSFNAFLNYPVLGTLNT